MRGRKLSAATLAKMSVAKKAHWQDPEYRAKVIAKMKGRQHSAATRAKIGAASRTRKASPETRAKMSASHQQHKTHCPYGHPYDEANSYINKKGYKGCRTCMRERAREKRARRLNGG